MFGQFIQEYMYSPTTQLVPASSATLAAFIHLERLPSVSWLMWVYPAGAKCLRKKVDFPRHGKPENTTSSVPAASGMICAVTGSSNGTTSQVNFIFRYPKNQRTLRETRNMESRKGIGR